MTSSGALELADRGRGSASALARGMRAVRRGRLGDRCGSWAPTARCSRRSSLLRGRSQASVDTSRARTRGISRGRHAGAARTAGGWSSNLLEVGELHYAREPGGPARLRLVSGWRAGSLCGIRGARARADRAVRLGDPGAAGRRVRRGAASRAPRRRRTRHARVIRSGQVPDRARKDRGGVRRPRPAMTAVAAGRCRRYRGRHLLAWSSTRCTAIRSRPCAEVDIVLAHGVATSPSSSPSAGSVTRSAPGCCCCAASGRRHRPLRSWRRPVSVRAIYRAVRRALSARRARSAARRVPLRGGVLSSRRRVGWDPIPGLALLRCRREPGVAQTMIRRTVAGSDPFTVAVCCPRSLRSRSPPVMSRRRAGRWTG